MRKKFNIAGPCFPDRHYMLPALDRLPEVRDLVEDEEYFVMHAPRQTGKTTALQALVDEINAKGEKVALYCTLETLQNAKDPARSATAIAALLQSNAEKTFPNYFKSGETGWHVCEEAVFPLPRKPANTSQPQ